MAPPKAGAQVNIPTKFPVQTIERMDDLIRDGRFSSRSVLVKEAVDRLLNEDRARAETKRAIEEELLRGGYDTIIEERVRTILGRVIVQKPE